MTIFRLLLACAGITAGIWIVSEWWETGLAKSLGKPIFSPNGCYRVDRLKPFWILPDLFHREPHPDNEKLSPRWFPRWGYPGFYRLYDQRTGELLGQSEIYDLESASGPMLWGSKSYPMVSAGLITIGPNAPDCVGDRPSVSGNSS